jgi:hypothetical protein
VESDFIDGVDVVYYKELLLRRLTSRESLLDKIICEMSSKILSCIDRAAEMFSGSSNPFIPEAVHDR